MNESAPLSGGSFKGNQKETNTSWGVSIRQKDTHTHSPQNDQVPVRPEDANPKKPEARTRGNSFGTPRQAEVICLLVNWMERSSECWLGEPLQNREKQHPLAPHLVFWEGGGRYPKPCVHELRQSVHQAQVSITKKEGCPKCSDHGHMSMCQIGGHTTIVVALLASLKKAPQQQITYIPVRGSTFGTQAGRAGMKHRNSQSKDATFEGIKYIPRFFTREVLCLSGTHSLTLSPFWAWT